MHSNLAETAGRGESWVEPHQQILVPRKASAPLRAREPVPLQPANLAAFRSDSMRSPQASPQANALTTRVLSPADKFLSEGQSYPYGMTKEGLVLGSYHKLILTSRRSLERHDRPFLLLFVRKTSTSSRFSNTFSACSPIAATVYVC